MSGYLFGAYQLQANLLRMMWRWFVSVGSSWSLKSQLISELHFVTYIQCCHWRMLPPSDYIHMYLYNEINCWTVDETIFSSLEKKAQSYCKIKQGLKMRHEGKMERSILFYKKFISKWNENTKFQNIWSAAVIVPQTKIPKTHLVWGKVNL